ncbi:DUF2474 domain-containing protein [Allopusillimonas ginsengisoli]|uniref:DUF2474 domain-containing protein n=1 Tax=Allopusillimonas ginsengisoli TaxID=453575 RepID=UPI0039C34FD5
MATTDLPEQVRSGSTRSLSPLPSPPGQKSESSQPGRPARPWWSRLGWLVFIWGASIVVLAVVAGLLKLFMNAAGLTA